MILKKKAGLLMLLSGVISLTTLAQNLPGFMGRYNLIGIEKPFYLKMYNPKETKLNRSFISPSLKIERIMSRALILGLSVNYSRLEFGDKAGTKVNIYSTDYINNGSSKLYFTTSEGNYTLKTLAFGFHSKKYYPYKSLMPFGLYRVWDFGFSNSTTTIPKGYKFLNDYNIEYVAGEAWKYHVKRISVGFNLGKTIPIYKDKIVGNFSMGANLKVKLNHINNNIYNHFFLSAQKCLFFNQLFNFKFGLSYAL